MTFHQTRRQLLHRLGLTAGSSLFPSLLPRGQAQAATGGIPTRLLIYMSGYGIQRDLFLPKGTETSWALPDVYSALAPHKSDLIFLDGMDMLSTVFDPNNASNAHAAGNTHALSANLRRKTSQGTWDWSAISIDQMIAREINKPAPVTKFPSLELSVSIDGNSPRNAASGTGDYLPVEDDPDKAFSRLFPTPTGGTGPDMRAAQRKSALEFAVGRFNGLKAKVSALDKQRFDAHASALTDLERRLSLGSSGESCRSEVSAVQATRDLKAKGGAWWATRQWYETSYESQMRVAQLAFACDLTRVITLTAWDPEKSIDYTSGMLGTNDYHDLVHKTSNGPGGPKAGLAGSLASDATALEVRKKHKRFEAARFAKMLQLLRDIPTADNKTMLDHTIVLWASHIAWGGHDLAFLPWILAGAGGGAFKTGRFIQLPRVANAKSRPDGWADGIGFVGDTKFGPGHGDLFVSIANAMGVPITTFGEPRACAGPLVQLRG